MWGWATDKSKDEGMAEAQTMTPGVPFKPPELHDWLNESLDGLLWSTFRPMNSSRYIYFEDTQGRSSLSDTNMVQSGMIPFSEKFQVDGISAEIVPQCARVVSKEALLDFQRNTYPLTSVKDGIHQQNYGCLTVSKGVW